MPDPQQNEVEQNYDFFQRNLRDWLVLHRGECALLRRRRLVGFYASFADAYRSGMAQFEDERFSVQEVTDEPVHLGAVSVALA